MSTPRSSTMRQARIRSARSFAREREDRRHRPVVTQLQRPFVIGIVGTLGGLAAILVATVLGSLSTVLVYIVAALFIALGLDPLVAWLESKKIRRPAAITIVFIVFGLIVAAILWAIVPIIVRQSTELIQTAPGYLSDIAHQDWFTELNDRLGGAIDLKAASSWLQDFAGDPKNWLALSGGLLKLGLGVINGVVGGMIVFILTLYFMATIPQMKQALYSLVARRNRAGFADITEQITASVGGYVSGMVVLAAINAGLGLVAMLIFGVPFAGILAVAIFLITLVPLIGSVIATIMVTIVGLFNSPGTAIGILIYYLVYMQVEAYVLTPRIMNKTIAVPGSLVVIGAMAGGTLLGILGALIAIPVTASILLIIKKVVVPRQDRLT